MSNPDALDPAAVLMQLDEAVSWMRSLDVHVGRHEAPEGLGDELVGLVAAIDEHVSEVQPDAVSDAETLAAQGLTDIGLLVEKRGSRDKLFYHGSPLDVPLLAVDMAIRVYEANGEPVRTDTLLEELNAKRRGERAESKFEPLDLDDVHLLVERFGATVAELGKTPAASFSYVALQGESAWEVRGYRDGGYSAIAGTLSHTVHRATNEVLRLDPSPTAKVGRGMSMFRTVVVETIGAGVDPHKYRTSGEASDRDDWEEAKACATDQFRHVNAPDTPESEYAKARRLEAARRQCANCVVRNQCAVASIGIKLPIGTIRAGMTDQELKSFHEAAKKV